MITRILAALLLLYLLGYALFGALLPRPADDRPTDAIVVLTGGANRMERGLDLLQRHKAQRMLVSGVDRTVRPADLAGHYPRSAPLFACCIDLGREAVVQFRYRDLAQQLGEEAADHQLAGLELGDAAGHQVEQLLVVEPAGRAGVPGAGDLAGLDLQVGDAVGAGAVGEQQVAVELVGVGALGVGADDDVTDPDGVRVLTLQRTLVGDAALAPRLVVIDEQPVLQVLAVVGEEQPEQLGVAAGTGEVNDRVDAHEIAAERHDN